jgi:exodeoxyribonuclease VII small subunit
MNDDPKSLNFEAALDELERLVEQMEAGDLTLEQSLQAFERGVALTRDCQKALKEAELRVQALTETDAGLALEDIDAQAIEEGDDD